MAKQHKGKKKLDRKAKHASEEEGLRELQKRIDALDPVADANTVPSTLKAIIGR